MNDIDPQAAPRETTPHAMLGGAAGVRALVDRFYDLMDCEPEFAGIRRLHAKDLGAARDKLFWFLSGWLGGPNLYVERFGHPMLRARHLRFPIGTAERDQWMACMGRALTESGVAPDFVERLLEALFKTADWMRNRPD